MSVRLAETVLQHSPGRAASCWLHVGLRDVPYGVIEACVLKKRRLVNDLSVSAT